MKILPLIKLHPTENEIEIPNRSWFPGKSHLQKQGKTERPVQSWFAIYKYGGRQCVLQILSLPPTKIRQGRASRKSRFAIYKDKGRQSVLEILVCYPQRQGKAERPGNSQIATYNANRRLIVLEILSLPPTKKRKNRVPGKILVCHREGNGSRA